MQESGISFVENTKERKRILKTRRKDKLAILPTAKVLNINSFFSFVIKGEKYTYQLE